MLFAERPEPGRTTIQFKPQSSLLRPPVKLPSRRFLCLISEYRVKRPISKILNRLNFPLPLPTLTGRQLVLALRICSKSVGPSGIICTFLHFTSTSVNSAVRPIEMIATPVVAHTVPSLRSIRPQSALAQAARM